MSGFEKLFGDRADDFRAYALAKFLGECTSDVIRKAVNQRTNEIYIPGRGALPVTPMLLAVAQQVWRLSELDIGHFYLDRELKSVPKQDRLDLLSDLANSPPGDLFISREAFTRAVLIRTEQELKRLQKQKEREERRRNKKWWQFWI